MIEGFRVLCREGGGGDLAVLVGVGGLGDFFSRVDWFGRCFF